ncbi:Hypothetical predicted protein [Cloeon dipterum]|uniref:Elongation of very long chain fatty acids protein n=2 Tax=Cloeon dipterum TaxID=197152 RepID=A0A8S1DAY4_9INSE|nr:Hypothetical predicted protein [Cloeon dipterum]
MESAVKNTTTAMAEIMHMVVDNYNELVEHTKDPTVDSWLLMSSPWPVFSILACYLYFVLYLGPKVMANHKPFQLTGVLIAYNFVQVIFSIFLAYLPFQESAFSYLINNACSAHRTAEFSRALSSGAWWYFFAKVTELLDTIFFVLRKKQSQVTFLHVYHHTITVIFSWVYLKYIPGEQGIVIAFLNSLVHVAMYTYYLIAAMGPKYQKYLWWKRYMTWIQLIQFCLMVAYMLGLLAYDCKLPKALTLFFVGNSVVFLFLFSDFYRKAYVKNKPKVN